MEDVTQEMLERLVIRKARKEDPSSLSKWKVKACYTGIYPFMAAD